MVQIDWDRIRAVKAVSLTDDEIEDLFPMVIRCEIEEVDDIYNLRALMKLSQEMLQYKDNQVESLLLKSDELKEKLTTALSGTKNSRKAEAIDKDNNDTTTRNFYPPDGYEDTIRATNDKIKTLMHELEGLENENTELKEKLEILREEMEDATESMNEMTDELTNLRGKNIMFKDELEHLRNEKIALLNQIEEITVQQQDRDKIIDEFGTAVDIRVTEWKEILDNKDLEIIQLKEQLTRSFLHPKSSLNLQNTSQLVYLNEEIDKRDRIINELESKLQEATIEMNVSAELIEKMKIDAKKMEKSGRRKEQRDLLRKVQDANEKIISLQTALNEAENDLGVKSQDLCEYMEILKRYEDKDHGLKETLGEIKNFKIQLKAKNDHIEDLINVINKLEALNSQQEMQIIALREKLGLPEDAEISVEGVALRQQAEARVKNELLKQNDALQQENLDLKSDIRTLKYKLTKLGAKVISARDTIDSKTKTTENITSLHWVAEQEISSLRHKTEMEEIHDNVRIVVEENEALRKGMHEILDSIRDQDGSSTVEVQSGTLERLLEALDTRHLAGWYHPAMRLQERLNVIQGSNAELRSLIKQMRKEIDKKDSILRRLASKKDPNIVQVTSDESETEDIKVYISEIQRIQSVYRNELEEWHQERNTISKQNDDLQDTNNKLKMQLDIFEADLKAIETGADEIPKALATRSKEYANVSTNLLILTRKCSILEDLLNKESTKVYDTEKEAIAAESTYKKRLADLEKHNKLLENKLKTLKSNLANSVTALQYNELQEKYNEVILLLRGSYEIKLAGIINDDDRETMKDQLQSNEEKGIESLGEITDELQYNKINSQAIKTINTELQKQLLECQKLLANKFQSSLNNSQVDSKVMDIEQEINELRIENENLVKSLDISREEAQMHYTTNSLKILEVDNLRHQILDLQAISEDKETIARLGFELNSCKVSEMETNRRKIQLESEFTNLQKELSLITRKYEDVRLQLEDLRRYNDNKSKNYNEVIYFLQNQYAGATCLTSLQRFQLMLEKLAKNRSQVELQLQEAQNYNEKMKLQQEIVSNRLEIVDRLKEILEEQIGSSDVENLIHKFSENSQNSLNEFRLKRQIAHLENELQGNLNKLTDYERTMAAMEFEMINIQRAWRPNTIQPQEGQGINKNIPTREDTTKVDSTIPEIISKSTAIEEVNDQQDPKVSNIQRKSVSTQILIESHSVEVQIDLPDPRLISEKIPGHETTLESPNSIAKFNSIAFLQDQLTQALSLASERSAKIIKYESQITEYEAKITVLTKALTERDDAIARESPLSPQLSSEKIDTESPDKTALNSTITSLKKINAQKEETIARYQNLLKEDRDEHSKAAARLQEEIKKLNLEITKIKADSAQIKSKVPEDLPERDRRQPLELKKDIEDEKIARYEEQISCLEADLGIANELCERWRRLAEDRLQHMDQTRERLEAQHKSELESYRSELEKWKSETSGLRQQLSENRMKLAKGNISLSKELQDRDSKIEELTMAYQELQSELEIVESMSHTQQISAHSSCVSRMQEIALNHNHHQSSNVNQSELDLLRRQHKSITEKEKMYKDQIIDLKQQLSRRYMAEKSEEKKMSAREAQLEKKLKNIEEELNKARIQLDRDYRLQEAKRVKTAEELSLWEKQKKWQQTAEKLKKELKEKSEEIKKHLMNQEKLKAVISCMEREKWYLRSRIRAENGTIISGLSARPDYNLKIIEDLKQECQTLRDRISELTDRLETEDKHELLLQIEKQKRRNEALEAVTEGNEFVVEQLEKLETAKSILEKTNIKLETENFELRMEIEKLSLDTPRLKEKVEHLEKYVELLKVEKSSDSSATSSEKDADGSTKKSVLELERTIFVLKRVVEKLQTENKKLRINSKMNNRTIRSGSSPVRRSNANDNNSGLRKQYEDAKKKVVALETDLALAEQRIEMLEVARKEDENSGEIGILKQQLQHKSELLDKVKTLLTRAAVNEKALRQRIQQFELKQTLSTIPECHNTSPSR